MAINETEENEKEVGGGKKNFFLTLGKLKISIRPWWKHSIFRYLFLTGIVLVYQRWRLPCRTAERGERGEMAAGGNVSRLILAISKLPFRKLFQNLLSLSFEKFFFLLFLLFLSLPCSCSLLSDYVFIILLRRDFLHYF